MSFRTTIQFALSLSLVFMVSNSCSEKNNQDPCYSTQWPQAKEVEARLCIHVSASNPALPSGSPGSMYPFEFKRMVVSGNIGSEDCSGAISESFNLGNSYVERGVDIEAPVGLADAYWIGPVVYVYTFDNDKDNLKLSINVQITMQDKRRYSCSFELLVPFSGIVPVPGEMFSYLLVDIKEDKWVAL